MLIHKDSDVHRFKWLLQARHYARKHCRGNYEYYVIIDTRKDEVVEQWSY